MPRPDLSALGIAYRRIPIVGIGSHIYCDSRLILETLQRLHPLKHAPLSPEDKGLEAVLQGWSIDSGVFRHAANFIPFEHAPLARDPDFVADRVDYMLPHPFSPEQDRSARPESMAQLRVQCEMLEHTFFADGRDWILGSDKGPSAADIEAVFPFYLTILVWKADCRIIQNRYPRLYSWVLRFHQAVAAATEDGPKPKMASGDEVVQRILATSIRDPVSAKIDDEDTSGLKAGHLVEVWPTDSGISGRQRGELVTLGTEEICVRTEKGVMAHFPRWGFRIESAS